MKNALIIIFVGFVLTGSAVLVMSGWGSSVSIEKQGGIVTSSALSTNGIELVVTATPTTMLSGSQINITDNLINTLPRINNVSAESHWGLPSLIGPCSGGVLGVSLFSGYCTQLNISYAAKLPLVGPGLVPCPNIDINYFVFQPNSNISEIVGMTPAGADTVTQIGGKYSLSEYYSASASKFVNISTGTYTLVEGDEWGSLVFVHFTVI